MSAPTQVPILLHACLFSVVLLAGGCGGERETDGDDASSGGTHDPDASSADADDTSGTSDAEGDDASDDAVAAWLGVPCVPITPTDVEYCYAGRDGYEQYVPQDNPCQPLAPTRALPPVCDALGPITEWDLVFEPDTQPVDFDFSCDLSTGCPEVVHHRTLTTTEAERGASLHLRHLFTLRNGAALVIASSSAARGGASEDGRVYYRLVAITPELEILWQTTDMTAIDGATTTSNGDVLFSGRQSPGEVIVIPYGERGPSRTSGAMARLDQDTGEPVWVSNYGVLEPSNQAIRDNMLHGITSVECEEAGPFSRYTASASVTYDLDTGIVDTCNVFLQPGGSARGPLWLGDTPIYRTFFGSSVSNAFRSSISTLSPSGAAEPIVDNVLGDHVAAIRMADDTWIYPLIDWVRFNADGSLGSVTRPFDGVLDRFTQRKPTIPIIGYNDTTAVGGSSGGVNLISTSAMLDGRVETRSEFRTGRLNADHRTLTALQDGSWLGFGYFGFFALDADGHLLWSGEPSIGSTANFIHGQVLDDEHILLIMNRDGRTERGEANDLYVIRHVHGGVANTLHATYGYDMYESWVPPENPVLEGPEIEPRWTRAE